MLTYALLMGLTFFAINDPAWMSRIGNWADGQRDLANRVLNRLGLENNPMPPTVSIQGPEQR